MQLRSPSNKGEPACMHASQAPSAWILYLLECRNGALYAGITNDLEARLAAHMEGKGAKYTRANPPLRVVASRGYPDRSKASSAEYQVKKLPRARKLDFFLGDAAPDHG